MTHNKTVCGKNSALSSEFEIVYFTSLINTQSRLYSYARGGVTLSWKHNRHVECMPHFIILHKPQEKQWLMGPQRSGSGLLFPSEPNVSQYTRLWMSMISLLHYLNESINIEHPLQEHLFGLILEQSLGRTVSKLILGRHWSYLPCQTHDNPKHSGSNQWEFRFGSAN